MLIILILYNFDYIVLNGDKIHNKKLIFVNFYTSWCGSCKRFTSILEEISKNYVNKITFLKVYINKVPILGKRYNIHYLPTCMIFEVRNLILNYEPIKGANKKLVENRLKNLTSNVKNIIVDDF